VQAPTSDPPPAVVGVEIICELQGPLGVLSALQTHIFADSHSDKANAKQYIRARSGAVGLQGSIDA
jgi:hypothetical protein